jgi:hypothetical protein
MCVKFTKKINRNLAGYKVKIETKNRTKAAKGATEEAREVSATAVPVPEVGS